MHRLTLAFAFALTTTSLFFSAPGCSCSQPGCDFPVRCVDHCGAAVTIACGACPTGTMPLSRCLDAGDDAGTDAASRPDAVSPDVGTDASLPDAWEDDAAVVCDRPGYPVDSTATRSERTAVADAAAAFTLDTGVTVTFNDVTAAVTAFSGPIPVTLDTGIADPCDRALAAVQQFFAAHQDFMRIPTDMTMRACHYDDITDAEVVRIHGGTYDGRTIIGAPNDLVVHVGRVGTIRYFGGDYLPVTQRLFPEPCFDTNSLVSSVVGDPLEYSTFAACRLTGAGSIPIVSADTRIGSRPSLYVDATGGVHVAREVQVYMLASRVTDEQINSDLFCCLPGTLDDCVGKTLIVDEVTQEILQQIPNCITC